MKKKSSIYLVGLLLIVALIASVALVMKKQELRKGAFAGGEMYILEHNTVIEAEVGDDIDVEVYVGTTDNAKVSQVRSVLCYGPEIALRDGVSVRGNVEANTTAGFSSDVIAVKMESGGKECINFTVMSSQSADVLKSGAVRIARVKFKAVSAGEGKIDIEGSRSKVVGVNLRTDDKVIDINKFTGRSYKIGGEAGGLSCSGLSFSKSEVRVGEEVVATVNASGYSMIRYGKVEEEGQRLADSGDPRTLSGLNFTPQEAGLYVFEVNVYDNASCGYLCSTGSVLYKNTLPDGGGCDTEGHWERDSGDCQSSNCLQYLRVLAAGFLTPGPSSTPTEGPVPTVPVVTLTPISTVVPTVPAPTVPVATLTPISTVVPTVPVPTVPVATPTLPTGDGLVLQFKMSFKGLRNVGAVCGQDWPVDLIVMGGGETVVYTGVPLSNTEEKTEVEEDGSGGEVIFATGFSLDGFSYADDLAVFLRGPMHLQVKYGKDGQAGFYSRAGGEISLTDDSDTSPFYNFADYPILAGDVTGGEDEVTGENDGIPDGKVDGRDFSYVKSRVTIDKTLLSDGDRVNGDFDGDCWIGNVDLAILMLSLQERYDQLY